MSLLSYPSCLSFLLSFSFFGTHTREVGVLVRSLSLGSENGQNKARVTPVVDQKAVAALLGNLSGAPRAGAVALAAWA